MFEPAGFSPALWLPDALVSPQTVGTLRWATAGYISGPSDEPANTLWYPRIRGDVTIQQDSADAIAVGGMLSLGASAISLDDADNILVGLDRYGTADGRAATVRVVPVADANRSDVGTPLAGRALGMWMDLSTGVASVIRTDPVVAFRGMVQRVDRTGDRGGMLRVTDVVERLATPLQAAKYLGTGFTEGGDELKGKAKPVALGRVFNITPIYLGELDLGVGIGPFATYQVHWREVAEIEVVRIRGVEQTLVGGTPVVGQARVFASLGMFQLGGTADGAVTADVRGDAVGGYVSSMAGVIRRLVSSLGPQIGADDLDATAFAFAEADLPGEIGWYQGTDDVTCAQVATAMVASCGAVLAGGRAGRLRLFDPLAQDSDQFTLDTPQILACEPLELPTSLRPLPREVAIDWRPNWTALSDIAGSVPAADRERLASATSGPARTDSTPITQRVAQQRTLRFGGLYWSQIDAQTRANKWRAWMQDGPRMFRITTDRYLRQIECGHIGRITYPYWRLRNGVRVVVLGWEEHLAAGRVTMTVITQPET